MTARRIGLLAAIAAFAAVLLVFVARRSQGDAPPLPAPFAVPGTPAVVYDAILPEIRDRIARETKIVRVDSGNGAITMRFTAYLEDHSVRLVEVGLVPSAPAETVVTVASRPFSFLPGKARDSQDATLESSLAGLVRRCVEAKAAAPH